MILTSRIRPAGLDPNRVLVRPVHALSRDESVLLARELPHLRALLHTEPESLGRRVLALVQGHPKLLELADAAAADPARLAAQLAAAEAAVDGAALTVYLREGTTTLDAAQFLRTLTAWTTEAAATLPVPSRLLLQALCRMEETDRNSAVLDAAWAALWRRLDQPGDPPPLAAALAPLMAAALIAAEPANHNTPVIYRIHLGIAEAIHAATPEPVTTAVDAVLAAWWTVVTNRAIEQEQAGQDTSSVVVRAGLAVAPYLLRLHEWDTASRLLDEARKRDLYSPVTAQAMIPSLRRIAEATGAPDDLLVLAATLRPWNPREAEPLLRRIYDQASTNGNHRLASSAAGDLVNLLSDQGRLHEALTLVDQKIEHTRQAGLGSWTQLSTRGHRLQILAQLGHHEQVITELTALRHRLTELPNQPTENDIVDPWNVQEGILNTGSASAVALRQWQQALDLNNETVNVKRRRGASAHEIAFTRFNNYGPFIRLNRLYEAGQVLRDCQEVFETGEDMMMLADVYAARADLESRRGHFQDALTLQRTALRLHYVSPQPRSIVRSHHNLASYLLLSAIGTSAEQRAHRLAAALLYHLTGDTHDLTNTLRVLGYELHGKIGSPGAPPLPTTLSEVIGLVDAGDGVHFGDLVATLCPDPDIANQALADLLATAATLPKEP